MTINPKYKIGDNVTIINYGHLVWQNKKMYQSDSSFRTIRENEDIRWIDMSPELVGKSGVINDVNNSQGNYKYSVKDVGAWFNEEQLQFI